MSDRNFDIVEALAGFARARDLTILDVAIGALASMAQVVSVIAGATTPEQVIANARAGEWTPSAADLLEIDRITLPAAAR
jgi:aryl-alcohol dehydrogenase-like predicted oxidoreductase